MVSRGKKVVNYMEAPLKKKRKKTNEVRAYEFGITSKGRLTSNKIEPSGGVQHDTIEDELRDVPQQYPEDDSGELVNVDLEPRLRELYTTKSKGRGTIHVRLQSWMPFRQSYLEEIIAHEGYMSNDSSSACNRCHGTDVDGAQQYRCLDCFAAQQLCKACMLETHAALPLHRIQVWNGEFFDRHSLQALGLRIQLGHNGDLCANTLPGSSRFLVMDTNGFHFVNFDFCNCGLGPPRYVQLLRARLLPTTTDRPQAGYTFDILDTFEEMSLQGKTNAFDFYNAIKFKTDKSRLAPFHKYKDFAFAVRIWRHLVMLKRGGRAHDPAGVEATKPGEIAVECPACPHPDRNLPSDWKTAPSEERWLYTQFLAVDANFKLKLKDRGFRDVELAPGWAYFVEEECYQDVVNALRDENETNTCRSQHDAILLANMHHGRDYKATGTGAVVCGRHSLLFKNGVGDLQKGERYSNMDYIILSALQTSHPRDLVISYDIACQWSKNFKSRIPRYPSQLRFNIDDVKARFVVPKFHLPAHGLQCQTRYSLNFLSRVGRTYGEGVESEWAHINGIATSTREMAPAVRHETLNDHWGAWNWKKTIGFGDYFLKKLNDAEEWKTKQRKAFESLSENVPQATKSKWSEMIARWDEDTTAENPYAEPLLETSINDVKKEFADEDAKEARQEFAAVFPVSARSFISTGLELEERQRIFRDRESLQNTRTSLLAANAQNMRTTLLKQILQWRLSQDVYMPGVAGLRTASSAAVAVDGVLQADDLGLAENVPLYLPSDVLSLASTEICAFEVRLRIAQADDAIASIRKLLRAKSGIVAFKRANVNGMGNRPNTRMQDLLMKTEAKIKLAKLRYWKARLALIALEPIGDWDVRLKDLKEEDIRGPHRENDEELEKKAKRNHRSSEGRYEPSWIWFASSANKASEESLADQEFGDSVRVAWAKAKARMERWEEESQLLCEEMRRVLSFLDWKSHWWKNQRGKRHDASLLLQIGVDAYAAKQSAVYSRLAFIFAHQWLPRLRKLDSPPTWINNIQCSSDESTISSSGDRDDEAEEGGDEDEEDCQAVRLTQSGEADLYGEGDIPTFSDLRYDDVDVLSDDE